MGTVEISFDRDSGLTFSKIEGDKKNLYHKVDLETLNQMSLADLNYCISTNVFIDLIELHSVFRDYLWTEDGEVEPLKATDEAR
jgi:hypothetical protein